MVPCRRAWSTFAVPIPYKGGRTGCRIKLSPPGADNFSETSQIPLLAKSVPMIAAAVKTSPLGTVGLAAPVFREHGRSIIAAEALCRRSGTLPTNAVNLASPVPREDGRTGYRIKLSPTGTTFRNLQIPVFTKLVGHNGCRHSSNITVWYCWPCNSPVSRGDDGSKVAAVVIYRRVRSTMQLPLLTKTAARVAALGCQHRVQEALQKPCLFSFSPIAGRNRHGRRKHITVR